MADSQWSIDRMYIAICQDLANGQWSMVNRQDAYSGMPIDYWLLAIDQYFSPSALSLKEI